MGARAQVWYKQHELEKVRSKALRAVDFYGKLRTTNDEDDCRTLPRDIQ